MVWELQSIEDIRTKGSLNESITEVIVLQASPGLLVISQHPGTKDLVLEHTFSFLFSCVKF